MKTSQRGINLIKHFEGFRERAYKALPTEEYYTIGYGHYGKDVAPDGWVSEAEANWLLENDIKFAEDAVNRVMKAQNRTFNQNMFDALVSFTYNCGKGNLHTLCKKTRNDRQIGEALPLYNKAGGKVVKGLVRRREAEKELYFSPVVR